MIQDSRQPSDPLSLGVTNAANGATDVPLDLSEKERDASTKGLGPGPSSVPAPPADHVKEVAERLLFIFGACLFAILVFATVSAWFRPETLKDIIGFFGTVVATLGTLLGGVVAFYFARR
jgi:hypothetical protein